MMNQRIRFAWRTVLQGLAKIARWLPAFLPALAGGAAYFTLHLYSRSVPVLVFKADLGSALAVLGGLVSLPLLAATLAHQQAVRRGKRWLAEQRQEHEAERRRFLRRLDHELKNPLTGLRAALANLAGTEDIQERARIREDAKHQAERLSRLVADLRKLAELEERPLEQAQVNLVEILEETVEAACGLPAYTERSVHLVVSRVPWPLPEVTGDRDLLGLAFYNLIENALKYTRPEDAVEVRAAEDGRWITIEVADTGPGIPADDLPRLFEELYRGTNARGVEGSGLGLALVRRVIERHGGQVAIRSRQDGIRGTVVTVRLNIR